MNTVLNTFNANTDGRETKLYVYIQIYIYKERPASRCPRLRNLCFEVVQPLLSPLFGSSSSVRLSKAGPVFLHLYCVTQEQARREHRDSRLLGTPPLLAPSPATYSSRGFPACAMQAADGKGRVFSYALPLRPPHALRHTVLFCVKSGSNSRHAELIA